MAHWDIWMHGTSVHVEYPDRVKYIRRVGWGTIVRQSALPSGKSSGNWFHFAIPTPTQIDGDSSVDHLDCWVKAQLNTNARITKVHVWDGHNNVIRQDNLDLRGPDVNYYLNLPDQKADLGLVVCVHVEFMGGEPMGEVLFLGAAARFRD